MSTFPQLLRQTSFASFDPSITRVYTSTPSSVHKHGDWGLKRPIFRKKGPRFIKVSQLDAGSLLGSDWRSAESEARFINAYGNGRIQWQDTHELPQYRTGGLSLFSDDGLTEPAEDASEPDLMADVNAMSPREFERYLKQVKRHRANFLAGKLANMRPQVVNKLGLAEDRTLVNLGARRLTSSADLNNFQSGLMMDELQQPKSKAMASSPHPVHGISYSRLPSSAPNVNPLLNHPGRALERFYGFIKNSALAERARSSHLDQNRPWVVSYGGALATTNTASSRISSNRQRLTEGVDFSRKEKGKGVGRFKVHTALIDTPPRVVDLTQAFNIEKVHGRQRDRRQATPLDTFRFDIKLDYAGEEPIGQSEEPGTRNWVGKEVKIPSSPYSTWDNGLELGRNALGHREYSEAADSLKRWNAKRESEVRQTNAGNMIALLNKATQLPGPELFTESTEPEVDRRDDEDKMSSLIDRLVRSGRPGLKRPAEEED